MGQTFFQFKKFTVHQELCAMKVCTDACILGAIAEVKNSKRILDIGTGTGLLALMVAQRSKAEIDAVEIERDAALQASQNFRQSPWPDRLHLHFQSIQEYAFSSLLPYDSIVCNPPFFEQHLKAEDDKENLAWHSNALERKNLLHLIKRLLTDKGEAWILLSAHALGNIEELAKKEGLHEVRRIRIHERDNKKDTRIILVYSPNYAAAQESQFTIRNSMGEYTEEFKSLLKDYYLIF